MSRLRRVPNGQTGELYLGGAGLSRGYHRRPELTSERFIEHPTLGRIYRTGDLAHRAADGDFFIHGRLDAQVKIRGHRIELEEIETRLASCDGVREAACRVQEAGNSQSSSRSLCRRMAMRLTRRICDRRFAPRCRRT
jgi:acyl-coenzyme A synthetase/AMP-(fatty) acid ligase